MRTFLIRFNLRFPEAGPTTTDAVQVMTEEESPRQALINALLVIRPFLKGLSDKYVRWSIARDLYSSVDVYELPVAQDGLDSSAIHVQWPIDSETVLSAIEEVESIWAREPEADVHPDFDLATADPYDDIEEL